MGSERPRTYSDRLDARSAEASVKFVSFGHQWLTRYSCVNAKLDRQSVLVHTGRIPHRLKGLWLLLERSNMRVGFAP
jgi:hypothetical protein